MKLRIRMSAGSSLLHDQGEQPDRGVRHVAIAVAVEVVALVVVPVVRVEDARVRPAVRRDVERVAREAVVLEPVALGVRHQLDRPAVPVERVAPDEQAARALEEQRRRVPGEAVALQPAVGDVLEEEPVRTGTPVVLESVAGHVHMPRVHDRDTSAVLPEVIVAVRAAVGEHEVQAVAEIGLAHVAGYLDLARELEVDPVPVPGDLVLRDHASATSSTGESRSPEPVSLFPPPAEVIAGDPAAGGLLQVDPEEGVLEAATLDGAALDFHEPDRRAIVDETGVHVAEDEAANLHAVRRHPHQLVLACTLRAPASPRPRC